uniref:Uncharacterized protein n=1 Tax=Helianthus annuus TaxID=4232 RepID=A0A251TZL6_HELAN
MHESNRKTLAIIISSLLPSLRVLIQSPVIDFDSSSNERILIQSPPLNEPSRLFNHIVLYKKKHIRV